MISKGYITSILTIIKLIERISE